MGDGFVGAFAFLLGLGLEGRGVLVHALVRWRGSLLAVAWVEELVGDVPTAWLFATPAPGIVARALPREVLPFEILREWRYEPEEAIRRRASAGTSGPWEQELLAAERA